MGLQQISQLKLLALSALLTVTACGQESEQTAREKRAADLRMGGLQDANDFVTVNLRNEDQGAPFALVGRAIFGYTATLAGGPDCWGDQATPFVGNATNVLKVRRYATGCAVSLTALNLREASGEVMTRALLPAGLAATPGATGTFATTDGQRQLQMKVQQTFKVDVDSEILLTGQELRIDGNVRVVDRDCTTPWGTKVPDTQVTAFETLNFETAPYDNPALSINRDTFWESHGIRFTTGRGNMVVRTVSFKGEREQPASVEAWLCARCSGSPARNRLMDAAEEARVGRHFLSTTEATDSSNSGINIEYRVPVNDLWFDLIDVDGDEVWVVQAMGTDGKVIPGVSKTLAGNGYGNDSLTGRAAQVRLTSPVAQIQSLKLTGSKGISYFGFAFDNFRTGINTSCTAQ